ncbi:PAAR domain-containing protein [Pseudomonas caricapapayae]|uniref:PAAR motif protein n=1 Tax=Pseudomonas caricapapayae TaxID=46678 RepID=A0A3M6GK32_9PSED|nr:PAAR domain-containing protein [Pseudomonas caricapapayae]KAA8692983.1 PAAR domain-containing protein [Pseudomonas caricapapayae]RMM09569.1 PAAR motif protein [Pseudomonas caricapapayae]RMV93179.1 PAAR motif protein [Pseudomonas caricapapayae]
MKLLAIVQGDTTDHGGSVINGDQTKLINGFPVAHRGGEVICPLHGASKIIGEENNFHLEGNIIALERDLTSCGARLISRQQNFFWIERRSSAVGAAPDSSAGLHQEVASDEGGVHGCVQAIDSLLSPQNSMACDERFRLFNQQRSSLGHLGYVVMQDQRCTAFGALDLQGYSRSHTSPAVTALQLATTAPWPVME